MESAISSRLTSEAFMPSVPMLMPSLIEIVFTSIGVPPAARMPAETSAASSRWLKLHGIVPIQECATMTSGLRRSSLVKPTDLSCERAAARPGPSTRVWLRWRGSRGMSGSALSARRCGRWNPVAGAASVAVTRVPRDPAAWSGGVRGRRRAIAAIKAVGLVKEYQRGVRALNGIDLSVDEGEIFGFLGQNGSGKSTTIRILTTLLAPTAGRVRIAGLDIQREAGRVRERIGVALQEAGLDDLQSGGELLLLQGHLYGMRGASVRRRVAELLEIVDLVDDAKRPIRTYSGGMRRRLDLASALMHSPSIVFLDEPTTGLDPIAREAIWRYIERLNQEDGVTFFLTTQYLEEADRLAQRVAILEAGEIVAEGSPAELKAKIATDVVTVQVEAADQAARTAQVVRGLAGVEDVHVTENRAAVYVANGSTAVARIVRLLDDAEVPVTSITLTQPTLEDVFLRATGHRLQVDEGAAERAN